MKLLMPLQFLLMSLTLTPPLASSALQIPFIVGVESVAIC